MTCPYCNTKGGESAYHPGTCANCGGPLGNSHERHERTVEFWGDDKLLAIETIPFSASTRETITVNARKEILVGAMVFLEDVEL